MPGVPEGFVPFAGDGGPVQRPARPRSPVHPPAMGLSSPAVPAPLDQAWTRRALQVLEASGSRPSSPPRLHSPPGGAMRVGAVRPRSASQQGAAMFPGYIAVPGEQYSVPPALIMRSYGGWAEGQLQYQYGKLSPLTPTFAPSWVHDPPQRLNVNDLRLSPSQRAPSCYSPEFLTVHTGFAVDHPIPKPESPRPTSAAADTRASHHQRKARGASPTPKARPVSAVVLSPPGQHRALGHTRSMFERHQLQEGSGGLGQAAPPPGRPRTAQLRRPGARPLSPQYLPSPGTMTRWGGKAAGASTPTTTRAGCSEHHHQYTEGSIIKGLAHSPLTEIVRHTARSSFGVDGKQRQSMMRRASTACHLSRNKSMMATEGRMILAGTSTAARHSHYPRPTEAQIRMARPATHEARR